jgi:elongation factor 3
VSDKQLSNIPKSQIRESLLEVGFDDARQAELVSGLSGGWKMKLELARAMLHNADLLLLDEVGYNFRLDLKVVADESP